MGALAETHVFVARCIIGTSTGLGTSVPSRQRNTALSAERVCQKGPLDGRGEDGTLRVLLQSNLHLDGEHGGERKCLNGG